MMNAKQLIRDAEQRLMTECHKDLAHASAQELHNAVSGAAMDALAPVWVKKEEARASRRQAAYLSMEFLRKLIVFPAGRLLTCPWNSSSAVLFSTIFTAWVCWMMSGPC